MAGPIPPLSSAHALRFELSQRNLARAATGFAHEQTFGVTPSVLYTPTACARHGNFLPSSFRRILADPTWRARLHKSYTASARVPRRHDRRRAELDCATSSDALLMNLFCFPGMTSRPQVCSLLGVDPGLRPAFGVRARLPMLRGETDRTEIDMRLGDLLVEAKLTEGGFGVASRQRLERYNGVGDLFDLDRLPRSSAGFAGWQLLRGVLAAQLHSARFVVLCDARRADLRETWFHVLAAISSAAVRSRMGLLTWQELADVSPPAVRRFLAEKYGILGR